MIAALLDPIPANQLRFCLAAIPFEIKLRYDRLQRRSCEVTDEIFPVIRRARWSIAF